MAVSLESMQLDFFNSVSADGSHALHVGLVVVALL